MGETLILGAGLSGLSSAYVLHDHHRAVRVLEASPFIGGASRTVQWDGFRFDLGGHRLYTRNPDVLDLLERLLPEEIMTVNRTSRIYLNGRFVNYPLTFFNALSALGFATSAAVAASYAAQKACRLVNNRPIMTFEDWVVSRFGRKLYNIYFKTYSEKVWGVPCDQMEADFAAQRIKGMSFREAVKNMLSRRREAPASLVSQFMYPRLGFGRIPERMAEPLLPDRVHLSCPAVRLSHDGKRVLSVAGKKNGTERFFDAEQVISTIPLSELVEMLDPAAPEGVREAARRLRYRDMIILFLALDRPKVTDDHWIYFPGDDVFFGRIHEPKNWSRSMAPADQTGLVVEIFCYEHEPIWQEAEDSLLKRAAEKLEQLGLIRSSELLGGCAIRLRKAYPLYCQDYRENLALIFGYLKSLDNFLCTGRNGLFRYTSGDRYIEIGIKAAQNLLGLAQHDLDAIATEEEYAEK